MCRHDVPEQDVVLDPELGQHAVDDRGARLGRPGAGQLPLGGERDPADARTAVAGGFPDQHDGRVTAFCQVGSQPFSQQARTAVLVERRADPRPGELVYQCSQRPAPQNVGRLHARMMTVTTLTDGGQQPGTVAQALHDFLAAAKSSLDLALYDFAARAPA